MSFRINYQAGPPVNKALCSSCSPAHAHPHILVSITPVLLLNPSVPACSSAGTSPGALPGLHPSSLGVQLLQFFLHLTTGERPLSRVPRPPPQYLLLLPGLTVTTRHACGWVCPQRLQSVPCTIGAQDKRRTKLPGARPPPAHPRGLELTGGGGGRGGAVGLDPSLPVQPGAPELPALPTSVLGAEEGG